MSEHIRGLLRKSPGTHILTDDGKSIAQVNYGYDLPVQEANADRIVACWNACDGISTAVLEKGRVSSDAFQLEESRADKAEQHVEDLLSAFEEVLRISDRDHDAWHRAHAAIAKAKGGAQ